MDYTEMNKLFAKFGVVRDVYLPKKRSMEGKRFGFVRYDCSIVVEVAIQRMNGVWLQDKELKVKPADFHKHQSGLWQRKERNGTKVVERETANKVPSAWIREKHTVNVVSASVPRAGGHRSGTTKPAPLREGMSYRANGSYANMVKKGFIQGKNVPMIRVDTIGNGRLYRSVVASFAEHRSTEYLFKSFMTAAEGNFLVKRMGNKKKECNVGREVWLTCYGVLVHAWNVSTFCRIGSYWGEVVLVEEDTAKCARVDVGKVKIITHHMDVINQRMRLMVGSTLFNIRVAEEQASSDGNEDDDVEGETEGRPVEDGRSVSVSFITNSQDNSCVHREGSGEGLLQDAEDEESRMSGLPGIEEEAHLLGSLRHRDAGNEGLGHSTGLGPVRPMNTFTGLVLQSALHCEGNIQDIVTDSCRPSIQQLGLVFNTVGINLEVDLGNALLSSNSELLRLTYDAAQ
ncbi:Serine arginine-rich splicing factor 2, partial [Dionaea muscipula]